MRPKQQAIRVAVQRNISKMQHGYRSLRQDSSGPAGPFNVGATLFWSHGLGPGRLVNSDPRILNVFHPHNVSLDFACVATLARVFCARAMQVFARAKNQDLNLRCDSGPDRLIESLANSCSMIGRSDTDNQPLICCGASTIPPQAKIPNSATRDILCPVSRNVASNLSVLGMGNDVYSQFVRRSLEAEQWKLMIADVPPHREGQ